ncbi:hypothetical protein ACET8C_04750 [Aeromonas veronii]
MRHIDIRRFDNCKTKTWDKNAVKWSQQVTTSLNPAAAIADIGNKWSSLKRAFVKEFGDKCWYTETPRIGTDFDVDHFCPKGRIKDEKGNILKRNDEQHPGYWWKAYDIYNYRYSCIFANRAREDGGKVDYFPLIDEQHRAWNKNDDSDYDHRLILDPCSIEDVKSISFEIQTAEVACAYTEEQNPSAYKRVKFSKACLNLDEKTIKSERLKSIKTANNLINMLKFNFSLGQEGMPDLVISNAQEQLVEMCDRKSAFSAAIVQIVLPHKNRPYLAEILPRLDLTP